MRLPSKNLKGWREELQNLWPISLPSTRTTSHEIESRVTSPSGSEYLQPFRNTKGQFVFCAGLIIIPE